MRVLIIDEVHEILVDGLTQLGVDVDYIPTITREALIQSIQHYEGLVVRTKMTIDETVLSHASKLTFIARAGAGLDNIDTLYCDQKGIQYFNAGEANADAVGEHTLAILLSLCTKLQKADKEVRNGIWDRKGNTGWELKGKTVGIIGFGNTGKAVAQKLSGFGVRVLVYDKYLTRYGSSLAAEATIQEIKEEADIVTLHVPLTSETKLMIDRKWISECKKPIVLLNLSRGKVVKLEDVLEGLEHQKLRGAGLDVLENENLEKMTTLEKIIFEKLVQLDNVVLSPHVGGWTAESYEKISAVLLQKIKELTQC